MSPVTKERNRSQQKVVGAYYGNEYYVTCRLLL